MEDNLICTPDTLPVDVQNQGDLVLEVVTADSEITNNIPLVAEYTDEKFMGTIQSSVQIVWRYHLKTKNYTIHTILNDFYEDAVDLIDSIIETYQGMSCVTIENYYNEVFPEGKTETEYLKELHDYVVNARESLFDTKMPELYSEIDNFLALIEQTLYKLRIVPGN